MTCLGAALSLLVFASESNAATTTGIWNKTTGANWNNAANWTGGVPGSAAGDIAYLTNAIAAAITITNDLPTALLGSLTIGKQAATFFAFTITNNSSTSSGNALVFNNNGSGATLTFGPAANTVANLVNIPITLQDNLTVAVLNTTGNAAEQLNGVIDDGGNNFSITKTGPGVLRMLSANSYHGGTFVGGTGRLNAGSFNCFGFGSVTVSNGAQVNLIDASGTPCTNAFSIAGIGSSFDSFGVIRFSTSAALSGPVTLTANARMANANTGSGCTFSGTLAGPFELEWSANAATAFITNQATANTVGSTRVSTITSGMLTLLCNSSAALSTGPLAMNGGTLAINGYSFAVSNLSSTLTTSVIQNGHASTASTLTVGADNTTTVYAGTFVNGGTATLGLTKVGTGALTNTGVNTYTGPTTISNGSLVIGGAGKLGNGIYSAPTTNYGALIYNSSAAQTNSGVISGNGTLTQAGSGKLTLTANNTATGSTTIGAAATLALVTNGSLASSNIILASKSATFDISGTTSNVLASGQTLQGNGTVKGALTVNAGAIITVGGASGTTVDSLTNSGNLVLNGTNVLRIYKTGSTNDLISVTGNLDLSGGTLEIHNVGGTFGSGDQFRIFNATGTVTVGGVTILGDAPSAGNVWDTSLLGSGILQVVSTGAAPTIVTPISGSTNQCSASLSVVVNGSTPLVYFWSADGGAPFAIITNTPTTVSPVFSPVYSTNAHTVTVVVSNSFGTVTSGPVNVVVNDTTAPVITLLGASPMGVVQNSAYVEQGFTASDNCSGSVVLTTNNTVDATTLGTYTNIYIATDSNGNSSTNSRIVVVLSSFVWTNLANGSWAGGSNWSPNIPASGSGATADFSTLSLNSNLTVTLDGAKTIGRLLFGDLGNAFNWTLNTGSAGALTLDATNSPVISVNNQTATIGAVLAGTNGVVKSGSGTLVLGGNNTYSGTTTLSAGTLRMNAAAVVPAASTIILGDANSGSGTITLQVAPGTGTTVVESSPITVSSNAGSAKVFLDYNPAATGGGLVNGAITLQHDLWITNSSTMVNGAIPTLNGQVSGVGDLHFFSSGYSNRWRFAFNGNNFTGNLHVHGGGVQTSVGAGGTVNAIPDNSDVMIYAGASLGMGAADTFGALNGETGAILGENISSDNTSLLLTLGNNNHDGVYNGFIYKADVGNGVRANENLQIIKIGTGKQTFNGNCSNTAPTTVLAGSLVINSAYYAAAVTVSNGATLGGGGTLSSNVTLLAGATLSPGSALTTLTIEGNLTNSTTSTNLIELDKSTGPAFGRIAGLNTFSRDGVLQIVNHGPALAAGDAFPIFQATNFFGAFASVVPAQPDGNAALAWDTVQLASGTLAVDSVPVPGTVSLFAVENQPTSLATAKVVSLATDPDGDPLTILSVSPASTNGGSVSLAGGSIIYTPVTNYLGADQLAYTLSDGRGGLATGTVHVTVVSRDGFSSAIVSNSLVGTTMTLTFAGIPGYTYIVETTTNTPPTPSWWPLSTNTAGTNGEWMVIDPDATNTVQFYRSRTP
jgi:autotransporter-associated beta strand protein